MFAFKAYKDSLELFLEHQAPLRQEIPVKIKQHGPHLTQITQTFPFPINAYFVHENDGLTLIDTGLFGNAQNILKTAQSLGAPIKRIALTHAHGDHAGSLDALHALVPDAEVLISARESRLLAGERTLKPDEPQDKLRGSYQTCKTRPTRLLHDGDRVESLTVIAAPGHTPGQIAFLDARESNLIVGDAFHFLGGVAVSGTLKWRFPFPAWATWSKGAALESAKRLRTLEPSRLAVGHGDTFENPLAQMDSAILEAENALRARSSTTQERV